MQIKITSFFVLAIILVSCMWVTFWFGGVLQERDELQELADSRSIIKSQYIELKGLRDAFGCVELRNQLGLNKGKTVENKRLSRKTKKNSK